MTYLVQVSVAVGFGTLFVVLIVIAFLIVKGFGKITLSLYAVMLCGFMLFFVIVQLGLVVVFQPVHDLSVKVKNEMRKRCFRRGGFAAKKLKPLQEIKVYLSIAQFNFCYLKRSTKPMFNESLLSYSISVILSLPGNAIGGFFMN